MDPDRRRGLDAAVLLAALAVAWLTLTPAGGSETIQRDPGRGTSGVVLTVPGGPLAARRGAASPQSVRR